MNDQPFKKIRYRLQSEQVPDPLPVLKTLAASGGYTFLLAHTEDGVVWGCVDGKELLLSTQAFPSVSPVLQTERLLQARLFGLRGEAFFWKEDHGWRKRLIWEAVDGQQNEAYDETMFLWGDQVVARHTLKTQEGKEVNFSLVEEGQRGLRQVLPLQLPAKKIKRACLIVRHYLAYDEAGAAYVALSRLVDLKAGGAV